MSLVLVITDAGRAALVNAANNGTNAVRIASVGVSATALAATPATTILLDEIKRIATISGDAVAADVIHLIVRDESQDSYALRSFALYLDDGTLFGAYGQADAILEKSGQSMLLLAVDVTLQDISADQVTFGDTDFLNPPATTETAGVVELATDAEALALADKLRALTPAGLGKVFTAANILSRLLAVDGAGSGLDADLLDGRQASEFALLSGADFSGPLSITHSGLSPNSLSMRNTSWDRRLAMRAVNGGFDLASTEDSSGNARPLTLNGSVLWSAGNDGAGSGLDADLLDGRQGAEYPLIDGTRTFTGTVVAHSAVDEAFRAAGTSPLLTFMSADATSRWGFIQHGGAGSYLTIVNDQSGPIYLSTGGLNVIGIEPSGVGITGQCSVSGALTQAGNQVWHVGNDGAGSGLDADLLDGRQAAEFALLTGAAFNGPVSCRNMMAEAFATSTSPGLAYLQINSGNADSTGYIEFRRADNTREGYIGFVGAGAAMPFVCENGAGFAFNGGLIARDGNRVWDAGTDGAGSGMDADMVDGWHRDDLRQWANLLDRPGTFPPSAHTHGAADIAAAFAGALGANGYILLPGGLIFQWVAGGSMPAGQLSS